MKCTRSNINNVLVKYTHIRNCWNIHDFSAPVLLIRSPLTSIFLLFSPLAPGNRTLWSGVPVASIQKSFGSSGRDWKPGKKLPIHCNFFTCRFIRYSSTCYGKVRIDPLMVNIRNPDCFASPVVNAARFVVVLPCYLNRDLLSGPKGN